jgi:hypothetical protein
MEQGAPLEADSFSAGQELRALYGTWILIPGQSPSLDTILNRLNIFQTITSLY